MKLTFRLLVGIYMLSLVAISHAQVSCPPGMMPYGTAQDVSVCGPIPGYNQDQNQTRPQAPTIKWSSRWGAIAADFDAGGVGVSSDKGSRQEAEAAAITDCQARGGRSCKIETWYSNGCAAMVVGNNIHSTNSASTESEAIRLGFTTCKKAEPNCHVFYSGCSLPQRIQ